MGQGVIKITTELLNEKLGIKPGLEIGGVEFNPFRGVVEILLKGEELPKKIEGAYPLNLDPSEVMDTTIKSKEERKSKVGMSIMLTSEEYRQLESCVQPVPPVGAEVTRETISDGWVRIRISGRYDRKQVPVYGDLMGTWCQTMIDIAQREPFKNGTD